MHSDLEYQINYNIKIFKFEFYHIFNLCEEDGPTSADKTRYLTVEKWLDIIYWINNLKLIG